MLSCLKVSFGSKGSGDCSVGGKFADQDFLWAFGKCDSCFYIKALLFVILPHHVTWLV